MDAHPAKGLLKEHPPPSNGFGEKFMSFYKSPSQSGSKLSIVTICRNLDYVDIHTNYSTSFNFLFHLQMCKMFANKVCGSACCFDCP